MKKAQSKIKLLSAILLTSFFTLFPINYANAEINEFGEGDSSKYFDFKFDELGVSVLEEVETPTSNTTYKVNYNSNKAYVNSKERPWSNVSSSEDTDLLDYDFLNSGIDEAINAEVRGGVIYNGRKIKNIKGNFFGNHINQQSQYNNAMGGAIANVNGGQIDSINGAFVGNYIKSKIYGYGGAIYNQTNGKIGDINAKFIGNSVTAQLSGHGGAVYNEGSIENINGSFEQNQLYTMTQTGNGGAIYNDGSGKISNINADFIDNSVNSKAKSSSMFVRGGAIYNAGQIGTLVGNFENNSISSDGSRAYGGAIYNQGYVNSGTAVEGRGKIGSITGNFTGNFSSSASEKTSGGAIYNWHYADIGEINGNFTKNYTQNQGGSSPNDNAALGGAIFNNDYSHIGTINGNFDSNYINTSSYYADGGAIYNFDNSTIDEIEGNFINNNITSSGEYSRGGAIFNENAEIGNITGNFTDNCVENTSQNGYAYGGAIYNKGDIGTETEGEIGGIVNSTFFANSAKALKEDGAHGGAIYAADDIEIIADNGISAFDGNYIQNGNIKEREAIYATKDAGVTLNSKNNGRIIVNDKINGELGYKLSFTGDENSAIYINNDIKNADITQKNTITNIALGEYINNNNSLDLNSGILNINKMGGSVIHLRKFALEGGNLNLFNTDVDLEKKQMGRIVADSYESISDGMVNVNSMNVISDGIENVTGVYFADTSFKQNVKSPIREAYAPIYRYRVSYDNINQYNGEGDAGYFLFSRGGFGKNPSVNFNPAVLTSPVALQAGGQAAMNDGFNYVFEHQDAFTLLPKAARTAKLNADEATISTDFNDNLGSVQLKYNKGLWVRPHTTFEIIPLKNGPKVDAINYGTLFGYDTNFKYLKNGWTNVGTGYIGYMGSHLSYRGTNIDMSGGLLGLGESFYKNNFWTAVTASVGAGAAVSNTMYGREKSAMLLAGIASKTGYNFEFKNGRFIIQPIWLMSYTFSNMFDYTNAAGVKINSDPMHTLQLHPQLRFVNNFNNGWQTYFNAGMVWNLLNTTDTTANIFKLPSMHINPYVEYALGVQRNWGDNYTGFLQTMLRHGGRNSVALTAGFRWNIGKDKSNKQNNETL